MDAFSAVTSQPCLGSIVEGLRHTDRDTGIDIEAVSRHHDYWEAVRGQYAAFESGLSAPASEVYLHEMPGGQFTNLKAQGTFTGIRRSLARSRPHIRGREPNVRRHRQSNPIIQSGLRHGLDDGYPRPDTHSGRRPRNRRGLPRQVLWT